MQSGGASVGEGGGGGGGEPQGTAQGRQRAAAGSVASCYVCCQSNETDENNSQCLSLITNFVFLWLYMFVHFR